MGFWTRLRRSAPAADRRGTLDRGAGKADVAHLEQFVATRRGVEAYVEPPTVTTPLTVVLVAHDGEWTRRRIGDARAARELGEALAIPVYDVAATGYPPRMREWTARRKALGETGVPRSVPPPL